MVAMPACIGTHLSRIRLLPRLLASVLGQPADGVKAILLSGDGQSAFETEVDEDAIGELVSSSYIADPDTRTVKPFVGEARND